MTINEEFVLRQVADTWVVLPIGSETANFNGMIKLNETAALLWKTLEAGSDRDGLIAALMAEYDVDPALAGTDVDNFLQRIRNAGCLID